jgi:hypothetical protein
MKVQENIKKRFNELNDQMNNLPLINRSEGGNGSYEITA